MITSWSYKIKLHVRWLRWLFIVPTFSKRYYIIAFRALWDVKDNGDKIKAELNIWEKQKELDQIVLKNTNTMAVFSCMTAMQSSFLKRNMLDRK